MSNIGEIILAILSCETLLKIIEKLIDKYGSKSKRLDKYNEHLAEIDGRLDINERDACRTQMLLLMSDYPDEEAELMSLAQHYFCDLHGNWYMSSIFHKWLKKHNLEEPSWLSESKNEVIK